MSYQMPQEPKSPYRFESYTPQQTGNSTLGFASIIVSEKFRIIVKVCTGKYGLFVAFPSVKIQENWKDSFSPINDEAAKNMRSDLLKVIEPHLPKQVVPETPPELTNSEALFGSAPLPNFYDQKTDEELPF